MKVAIIIFAFAVIMFIPAYTEARSGCCSHHGGVCGCGCCDGSALSATCAPYYPSCNSQPAYTPPIAPVIPATPTTPTPTAIIKGCTDSKAINYNSLATQSDSSCIYQSAPSKLNTTSQQEPPSNSSKDVGGAVAGSVGTVGVLGGAYWLSKKIKK